MVDNGMTKIFSGASRAGVARVADPVARALLRAGISPDAVTVAGTVGVGVAAVGFATRGELLIATLIAAVSSFADFIDGAMARIRGRPGRFGALLDSTMDRVADGVIFASLAYWLATTGQRLAAVAALLCLIASQVVSYVKARAEGLGLTANVGLAERPERLILIGIGGLLHGIGVPYALHVVLWLLAVLCVITVAERMVHVHRQTRSLE
jgi:CDP-diacylglycerol--glycerol-3-phosphate 3-phosphatidyltransferase